MKKTLASLIILCFAAISYAQLNNAKEETIIKDSEGLTNYVGLAVTLRNKPEPSTTNSVWKIIRFIKTTNGVTTRVQNAYGDGVGDLSLWSNIWTNRANVIYK